METTKSARSDLNSSGESKEVETSNYTIKSTASELLAITDKAVHSIKSYRSGASNSGSGTATPYGELLLLSNTDLLNHLNVDDSTHLQQCDLQKSIEKHQIPENADMATVSQSNSLRVPKSPNEEQHNRTHSVDAHNTSFSSIKSAVSRTSSVNSFLSGDAKRVKVSAKKLREIKSPFDGNTSAISNASSKRSITSHNVYDPRQSLPKSNEDNLHNIDGDEVHVTYKTDHSISVQKHMENGSVDVSMTEHKQRPFPEGLHSDDSSKKGNSKRISTISRPMDSGYNTEKIKTLNANETQDDLPSIQDEVASTEEHSISVSNTSVSSDKGPITISANIQHETSQPEIVTVQETIVTVNAQSAVSSDTSMSSQHSDIHRFRTFGNYSKAFPSTLRQGSLSDSNDPADQNRREEVVISKFMLDTKQRELKKNFAKRQLNGAVKRSVQPKLIGPSRNVTDKESGKEHMYNQDAVTTAAMAAASAVAATQPFLKAQQEMEMRLASVLEKLNHLSQPQAGVAQQQVPAAAQDEATAKKMSELEQQLKDLTQRRLDYLEKVQSHQFATQAELLAISRHPQVAQHSPLRLSPKQQKSAFNDDTEKSLLDTPAPRRKPPSPAHYKGQVATAAHTPEKRPRKAGYFLEEILNAEETPKRGPFEGTPDPHNSSGGTKLLLQELGDLRREVNHAVADARQQKRHDPLQNKMMDVEMGVPDFVHPRPLVGPTPLDEYLKKPVDGPEVSPYPSLNTVTAAPVRAVSPLLTIGPLDDASATLKKVQESRRYLEANLDAMLKARQEGAIYGFLDQLTKDRSAVERLRIKNLVDEHIKSMNSDLQREIMHELLKLDEVQHQLIPEREKPKVFGGRGRGAGRGGVTARTDSGLRPAPAAGRGRGAGLLAGKENVPIAARTKKSTKPLLQNEKYVDRVYGKALQKGQKPAAKKTAPPVTRRLQPPAKGILKPAPAAASVYPPLTGAQQQFYLEHNLSPAQRMQHDLPGAGLPAPLQGQLIPVAIPLGVPVRQGGLTQPVIIKAPAAATAAPPQAPPTPAGPPTTGSGGGGGGGTAPGTPAHLPYTSTPMSIPVRDEAHDITQEEEVIITSPRKTKADKLVDAELSAIESASVEEQYSSDQDHDDTITSVTEGPEIALPGYSAPELRPSTGPAYPPQKVPPMVDPPPRDSEAIAAQLRERDLLQNHAMEWIESELMARMISEMYVQRARNDDILQQQQEAAEAVATKKKQQKKARDEVEDSEASEVSEVTEVSPHDSMIAEMLGPSGMQLFVDAGAPIDEGLVNNLVRDVLLEKLCGMVGERTAWDDEKPPPPQAPKPAATTSSPRRKQPAATTRAPSPPLRLQMPRTPVATPDPTPKHSPVAMSPTHRERTASPPQPPETPALTPQDSVSEVTPPLPAQSASSKSVFGMSETDEDSTKERDRLYDRIAALYNQRHSQRTVEQPPLQAHDVETPEKTPPLSPPVRDNEPTPEPSIHEQEVFEPVVQPVVMPAMPAAAPPPPREPSPPPSPPTPPPQVVEQEQQTSEVAEIQYDDRATSPVRLASPPADDTRQQTPPPPAADTSETSTTVSTTSEEEETSESRHDYFSEGQWLLSVPSEGEVAGPQIDPDLKSRVRQRMLEAHRRSHGDDDTLYDAKDLDQEDVTLGDASEGEFLGPAGPRGGGRFVQDAGLLHVLAAMKPRQPGDAGHALPADLITAEVAAGNDRSLGEVSIGQRPRMPREAERIMRPDKDDDDRRRADDVVDSPVLRVRPQDEDTPTSMSRPSPSAPSSASQQARPRVIMVQSPPPGAASSPEPRRPGAPVSSASRGGGLIMSTTQPPRGAGVRRAAPTGRSKPPARPVSPDSPRDRGEPGVSDSRDSVLLTTTTMSDEGRGAGGSRTMTPDQINVEALLATRDYYNNTQSDVTGELRQSQKYTGELTHSGVMERLQRSVDMEFGSYTLGSTSDISLPPGLTQTMERSASADLSQERLTHSLELERDPLANTGGGLQGTQDSIRYPDSLEGTGDLDASDQDEEQDQSSSMKRTGELRVYMPSMGEEDESESYEENSSAN